MNKPIDNSQIKVFQECPFKYFLQYKEGLVSKDSRIALEFGSAVHDLLEKNNKNLPLDTDYNNPEELARNREGLELLIKEYLNYHNFTNEEILDVEKTLSIDLDGVEFVVKPDLVYKSNGEIYGREYKSTASAIDDQYFDRFFINSQISAQIYAINKHFGQCSGICVDVLSIRFLKRKSKIREAGFNAEYDRSYVSRTSEELEIWKENTIYWAKQIKNAKFYPKASANFRCNARQGRCEYRLLCKRSTCNKLDEGAKELYYERTNPYEYLGF